MAEEILVIIGLDDGFSPVLHQDINWVPKIKLGEIQITSHFWMEASIY